MAATSYSWPVNSSTVTSTSPSTGVTGITAPVQATEVGFIDGSGNLQPFTGTVANGVLVNVSGLPAGLATSALQTTGNTSLAAIATSVAGATPAGANIIGQVSINQTTPGTTNLVCVSPNASGSYAEIVNLTTSAQTFTAPANSVGFLLMALGDNTVNLRWKIGSTATTSSGMRLEPGRDTGYIPCNANISIITESGSSQSAEVQWFLRV